jgi:hypothetical protein
METLVIIGIALGLFALYKLWQQMGRLELRLAEWVTFATHQPVDDRLHDTLHPVFSIRQLRLARQPRTFGELQGVPLRVFVPQRGALKKSPPGLPCFSRPRLVNVWTDGIAEPLAGCGRCVWRSTHFSGSSLQLRTLSRLRSSVPR